MCFLEFNWTANVWQFRFGDTFTDFRGTRSWPSLCEAREFFAVHECELRKTDTRTYQVSLTDAALDRLSI